MLRMNIGVTSALSVMLLAGCGSSDEAQGPGGLSAGEAQALNQAAEILDERAANAQKALNEAQGD